MSMDAYIARQPIFDRRMKLYGYELLHRKSQNNFYEGSDDNHSTAALINNAFLVMGFDELIGGTKGFINFSQELLQNDVALLLPKDRVVIEILEGVEPTDAVIASCRKLKSMGYTLALDDFVSSRDNENCARLIALADIIKVEYPAVTHEDQRRLLAKYKNKITFLAEKVERQQDYQTALQMGYTLFQGYFFSRPIMINAKEMGSLDRNLIWILEELNKPEPKLRSIAGIIERDLGLSYKLLKMANSIYYGSATPIKSIYHVLVHLGTQEMIRWIHLMLLLGVQTPENEELVKTSQIRGRMLSLLALERKEHDKESEFFIVGLFSSIDVLLNKTMESIVGGLPLSNQVRDALLGKENELQYYLNCVLSLEMAHWDVLDAAISARQITRERFMSLYLQAIKWQQSISN